MTYFPPQSGPCVICGDTNYGLSCGGPTICPKCDCGNFDAATVEKQAKVIADLRAQLAARPAFEVPTAKLVKTAESTDSLCRLALAVEMAREEYLQSFGQESHDALGKALAELLWDNKGAFAPALYELIGRRGVSTDFATVAEGSKEPLEVSPRLGGIGVDWWAESVKLYRQNKKLSKALQEQHDWHLSQGEQDFGDGIKLNMADEYADSSMCERTTAALGSVTTYSFPSAQEKTP